MRKTRDRVTDYRETATTLRERALTCSDDDQKQEMLTLAAHYERLALSVEKDFAALKSATLTKPGSSTK